MTTKKRRTRQKKAPQAPKANGLTSLTQELWQAAVNLRGSIEPSDYKRYVLPIIFLRFLSLKYEKRRAELESMIADPESEYYSDSEALEDSDEFRQAGAFVLPENARWDHIRRIARADDIKVKLDDILESLERAYPQKLRGLLPRIYAGSNMDAENLRGLINLFSKDIFSQDHGGEDALGRIYEYFIGEFASSEGKRGGEYFTPASIVRTLVAMLEPEHGVVYDPCCGAGGMFVQADEFTKHNRRLSFFGQESKDFTYRLCRMNLFIHGVDGNIQLGNTYWEDKHAGLEADYILANPPFNDGAKGEHGWGAHRISSKDPRLVVGGEAMPLADRNANTMWIMHFLSHLKAGGTAGFVMAAGELSCREGSRARVRQQLVEKSYVDCIVTLSGKLFANTQSPVALWFLSKARTGVQGQRQRTKEVLFIDGRALGSLIPGSRRQKQLTPEDVSRIADLYHQFRFEAAPDSVPGFAAVACLEEITGRNFALTPNRYVGAADNDDDEPFEEVVPKSAGALESFSHEAEDLHRSLRTQLAALPDLVGLMPQAFEATENGPIPKGWSPETIGSVTSLVRRGRAPKYLPVGGMCVINQKCIRNGEVNFALSRRHDASARPPGERLLQMGDVLVNSTGVGTLGRLAQVCWLPEEATVDSHVTICRPDSQKILPEVFGAIMLSMQSDIELMGEGSTGQTELGRERLASLPISVPPMDQQERLAALLRPMMKWGVILKRQDHALKKLRDAFVARIAGGELTSSDAALVVDALRDAAQ